MGNKGYVFIGNGTKPAKGVALKTEHKLDTVELSPVLAAKQNGYDLYVGINHSNPDLVKCLDFDAKFYDEHCYRNIFAIKDNLVAIKNLNELLKKHPEIDFIHCNTPIGGVVGRLCGKLHSVKHVVYTAHGFHFFKGAPLFNRTILKWIEIALARWTDVIITMNNEDYQSALRFKLRKGGKVYKVHGVGIDTSLYEQAIDNKEAVRKSLGLSSDSVVCMAMGDVVPRKNFKTAIEAIALAKIPNLHYLVCGVGPELDNLKAYAKDLNIDNQIHFLGFRRDIMELSYASDFFLFSSLQEGLPRSIMEAMCAGLPCIVSDIRGNNDLIDNGKGGFLAPPTDSRSFADAIIKFVKHPELWEDMSAYNKERIKSYDINVVKKEILDIYNEILS